MKFLKPVKTHISIFLAFIIFTMSFSLVYADTNSVNTTQTANEAQAIDFLKAVGVIPQEEILGGDTDVTRAYFSYLAVLLSGYDVNPEAPVGQVFSDVNSKTQYAPYIEAANKLGFIHGSGGKFNPEEKITLVQALKIITHILGYENYASVYGGYPTGYVYLAQKLDLTDGLQTDSNAYLNSSDAMLLLENAANTELMQFEAVKGDDVSLDTIKGETLLYKYHGVACVEGIIEANGYTNLYYEESNLAPRQILLDGVIFDDPDASIQDYIGLNVRLFYDYKSPSSVKTAKYAYILEDNNIIKLLPEEINVSNGKISYYTNTSSEKTINISSTVSCIFNGKMTVFNPDELLSVEKGSIEFISYNSDNIIDVVKIIKYTTMSVKAVSASSGLIIADDGSKILLEEDEQYDFEIIKNNSKSNLSAISRGDILLVSQGTGKGYYHISILASDKKLIAPFDEICDDYVIIGNEKYQLDSHAADNIKIGVNYKICFDMFDNVSYVEVENDMVYGFLYGIAKQGLGKPQCSIFTENNRWVSLDFADKIKYNGTTVTQKELYSQLSAMGDGYKKLIRYNVNEVPELIKLESYVEIPVGHEDEAQAEKDDIFRLSYSGSATYRFTPKSFTGKFFVDSNTKVFAIPDDMSEENFKVKTISALNSDNSYSVNAFNIDENLYSNVITIPAFSIDADVSYTDRFTVVKSKGEIVNIKGEAVPSLRCWRNGNEVAFPVTLGTNGVDTDTYNSLKQGDVVQFKYDEDNNIVYLKKYPVESIYYTSGSHYSSSVVIGASVKNIDISGKRLRLVYTDGGDELGVTYTSTTTATLWDKKTQTCTDADISEIIPGDIIFATMRYHVCYDIMIIRN